MTISEIHTAFKLEIDKSNSLDYPSFEPEEIDYWVNKAYLALVNQKMFGNNSRNEAFDASQKREDDLKLLVLNSYIYPSVSSFIDNCLIIVINEGTIPNYLYFISSRLIFTDGSSAVNLNISHNEKDKFVQTAVNVPWIKNPVVYTEGNHLYILYDKYAAVESGSTPSLVEITYLRRPETLSKVSNPSQIPLISEHVHQEIATLAAYLAIENISSPRIQTSALTLNKLE